MVYIHSSHETTGLQPSELVAPGEVIAVVDDSEETTLLLSHYLASQGLMAVQAESGAGLLELLTTRDIALVLLDIGLPDKNGNELLKEIVPLYPDLGIVMVTGTVNIKVALDCLRLGADDYLTKPLSAKEFNHTVASTLQKRRLAITSRSYQKELQITNSRLRFLHQLNLKLNSAYLNSYELKHVLQAILVGITDDDGLGFNRAFLALFDEQQQVLQGRVGIDPSFHHNARKIWHRVEEQGLRLDTILEIISHNEIRGDLKVNTTIKRLRVLANDQKNVLIQAISQRRPIYVHHKDMTSEFETAGNILEELKLASFVAVPLYSRNQNFGVIMVDNYFTGKPISQRDIHDLEIFASQASLAIEHSHLYQEMAEKIEALEQVTRELDKNRDLLLDAERKSTIGRMSSQLLHTIRNPLTSIGGTSRLLTKKTADPYLSKFLKIITEETNKIERTLDDLFTYVVDTEVKIQPHPIYSVVRKIVMVFYTVMKEKGITYELSLEGSGPHIPMDENKIRQLFLHLIRNSIEAMPQGGVLSITARKDEKKVTILIADSGQGIPPENLDFITSPFFSTKPKGTGMGLALAEQIVQAHHGSLSIESNQEEGTSVTIQLPCSVPAKGESSGHHSQDRQG